MGKEVYHHDKPLRELQWDMTGDIAKLIVFCNLSGYRVRFGDAYRDPRVFGEYGEKMAYASKYSNHKLGIAVDLPLFTWSDGDWDYEKSTYAYAELGEYWEEMRPENVWGGHWADGNHFSKWYQGRW